MAVVTFAVYSSNLQHKFVYFDDKEYVIENPHVHAGLSLDEIRWVFTHGYAGNWHPLTWISHMVDCQVWGLNPAGHHLTSLLLHVINVLLLFLVLMQMTGERWRSALVAALFAWHPLHVESVAWVSERKDVLSGFFFLLTLLCYASYARSSRCKESPNDGPARDLLDCGGKRSATPLSDRRKSGVALRLPPQSKSIHGQAVIERDVAPNVKNQSPSHPTEWYVVTLAFFALGLMAKPMLVTLPFVLLLLDYWPLCRISSEKGKASIGRLVLEKAPLFLMAGISSLVTFLVQRHAGSLWSLEQVPLPVRLENSVVSYAAYIGKMFWPVKLAVFYPYRVNGSEWAVVGAFLLLGAVTAAVVVLGRPGAAPIENRRDSRLKVGATGDGRFRFLVTGWFWYLGMLVPVIGLVQTGGQAMADRYTYLPMIGLFIIVAWMIPAPLPATVTGARHLCRFTGLTGCGVRFVLERAGKFVRRSGMNAALQAPDNCILPAASFCTVVLTISAAVALLACLVLTYRQVGYWADNKALFQRALAVTGPNAFARVNLAESLRDEGDLEGAVRELEAALAINPKYRQARHNLGAVFMLQGKLPEASEQFQEALRIYPDYAIAHNNLAEALMQQGNIEQALAHWATALKLEPDLPEALNNLAWVKATTTDERYRDGKEAVRLASRAVELTQRKNPSVLDTLAAALAESGDFEQASAVAEEAQMLAVRLNQQKVAEAVTGHLALYRSRMPCRGQ